jgi:hypothetical protein
MSVGIRLTSLASIVALGTVLATTAFAQDDLNAGRHFGASDRGRTETIQPYPTEIYFARPRYFRQCSDSPARC